MNDVEEQTHYPGDRKSPIRIVARKPMFFLKDYNIRDLWGNRKLADQYVTEIPEGEE